MTFISQIPREYFLDVPKGNVPDHARFAFGGNILDLKLSDGIRDIWNGPGNRTKLAGAAELFLSSTDPADDAIMAIAAMDDPLNEVVALGTLNGQAQVSISIDIWRSFFFFAITGAANGTLYLAEADTLTAGVPDTASKIRLVSKPGFAFGAIAKRTVPAGYSMFGRTLTMTPNKAKDATFYFAFQPEGETLKINPASFELFQTPLQVVFDSTFMLDEKTELPLFASTSDENATASALFEGYLVKNN